jgi:hypothetical protein
LELNWAFLRERLAEANRSPDAAAASAWAVDVLEETFGWPRAWRDGGAPTEVAACFWHVAGFLGTLELALALYELREVDGVARVRDAIRGSGRSDQKASPSIQLKLAALAKDAAIPVRLEPKTSGAPCDLLLGDELLVEVLALVRDATTLAADRWLSKLTPELRRLGREHGVRFDGDVLKPLDEARTAELVAQLEAAARVAAQGIRAAPVGVGGVTAFVTRAGDDAGGSRFRMPAVDHARRLHLKLQDKAEQTKRSGANWIFCNVLSDMWRLTAWSQAPLPQKATQLAALVRAAVGGSGHLRGVVMSDGAAVLRPDEKAEEWAALGLRALKLRLDRFRVRETIAVGVSSAQTDELALWQRLLRAEPGWLASALSRAGLEVPPEVS